MAVAVDATGTEQHAASGTSLGYTGITVGSGSNRALIVTFGLSNGTAPTGVTATWDNGASNQAMTQIRTVNTGGIFTYVYGLRNPVAGNKTLQIAWTNTNEISACAISFTGVDQVSDATAFPNANSATGSSTTASLAITSATGNIPVTSMSSVQVPSAPNQTQIYLNTAMVNSYGAQRATTGAATVTFNWTIAPSGTWIMAGCDVAQVAASSNPFYKLDWGFQRDLPGVTTQDYVRNPSLFPNPIPFQDQQQRHTRQVPLVGPPQSLPLNINLFTNPIPFSQTDWSPQKPFYRVSQQTQPYNNSVYTTTVVAAPFYTQDFATSHTIPDWASPLQYTNLVLQNFSTPFSARDFSKPFVPTPAKQDQQALNVNLFTNPIPFAQYDWSKPQSRTITPDVNLLNIALLNPVVVSIPFNQLSWPKGSPVPQAPFDVSNVLIVSAAPTPFAQYDWAKPQSVGTTTPTNFPNTVINQVVVVSNPFYLQDWSRTEFLPSVLSPNLPNIVLLNPTGSPFFSQDFSRPFVPPRVAVDVQSVNTNLFTNPVPLNQIDWSKPYRIVPIVSDQNSLPNIILYQPVPSNPSNPLGIYSWADLYKYVTLHPNTPALLPNLTLILPPPPPDTGPIGGWRWIDGVMRMREKQLDHRDQNASAVMLGKLGGLARAQALTTKQRSNIASKAAQVRWNPPAKKR